jgi:predicted ATPase
VVDGIYAETDGNPFFVEELFRYLQDENRLYDEAGSFRTDLKIAELEVPQSVRLVIGRRLERLAKPTQKILGSAAVIGRHFSFKVLQAAVGSDGPLDYIDEAERAGLIFSSATTPDASFEFSHELIRQVVLSNQSAARRQQLHLQVAGAVEHFNADYIEDHLAELACQYHRGD